MSDTRRSSYEETTLERLVAALAAPTNVVLGIGLALVLAGVVWVTGLLGERILLGFTEAARRSFATENYALVWLGANFATGVKALLWAVAFWQLRDLLAGYGLIPDPRGAAGAALRLAAMFVAAGLGAAVQVGTGLPLIWPLAAVSLLATEYLALRTKVPAIALREFKALLLNPLGYVVLAGFAVVAALMFAGAVNELAPVDAAGVRHPLPDQALLSIQPLTAFFSSRVLGFGFLILIPIITMRLVSEEKRSGTLEVLMTSPVAEWQVVAGKFLGAYGFYLVLWAVLLVHIWLIHGLGRPDLNVRDAATTDLSAVANGLSGWQVAGAYAGIALIGAGFLAIGLFCSCLAANQLAAAVLTLVALLAFTFQGFVENLPVTGDWAWFGLSARYLDLRQHLEWSARGTPDSRTVFLFLTLCGMFLFLSVCAFASRRWNDMNLGAFTGSGRALTAALGTLAVAAAAFAVLHDGLRADPAAVAEPLPPRLWKFAAATAGCIALGLLLPKVLGPARLLPAVVSVGWFAALQITDPVRLLPELPDGYNYAPAALKAAVAGLAALIAFLAVVPRLATLALTNRLIYGANVVVGGLAVLVIAVMANYLAVRYNAYLDWSPEQAFTLHPISVATLAGLAPDERPGVERAAEAARKAEAGFDELIKPDAAPEPSAAADVIASLDAALSALRGVAVAGPPVSESRLRTAKWDGAQPDTIREKLTLARNKLSETYPDANAAMTERRLARGHVADAAAALARLIPKRKLPDGSEADDIGIPEGETVRAIAFVGRYDPPKDRAEALDNVRRDTLERLFRRYADSLNRPGDVKFEYEFVDPRSEREADRLKTLRNRHSVEGVRDVLLLFNNRQFVLNDEDLFKPTLTLRRFAELCSAWNREFERGQHRTKPPEPTEINRAAFERHKDIPLQFGEYGLREEDFELSAVEEIEQVVTNAVLRLVRGRLNILYFTQGHGEREAFPEGTDAAADAKKPALKKPDGEKDKGKDKDRKKDDRELTAYEKETRKIVGARRALQKRNFQVRALNANETKGGADIPADCSVLVIVDPTEDFLKAELDSIERYLRRGGRLALMLDPRGRPDMGPFAPPPRGKPRAEPTGLVALAARFGVIFEDGVAVFKEMNPQAGERPVGTQVILLSGDYKPGPEQANRFYKDVFLAGRAAIATPIKKWLDECQRQPHPFFPGVTFAEARPLKADPGSADRVAFTALVSTGKAGPMGGGPAGPSFYRWDKAEVADPARGPVPPKSNPFGDGGAPYPIVALAEPRADSPASAGSAPAPRWRFLALGDSDWLCDAPVRDPGEDDAADPSAQAAPSFLNNWLRGGERLLLALMREMCRDDQAVAVPAKRLRPFRAVTERTVPGELLVNFRPEVTETGVSQLLDAVSEKNKGTRLENGLRAERYDLRRVYEFRFRTDGGGAGAGAGANAGKTAADLTAAVRGLPRVIDAQPVPGGEAAGRVSLNVEFEPGAEPAAVAEAAKAAGAEDAIPRLVRNQWRVTFDRGLAVEDEVKPKLLRHNRVRLTPRAAEELAKSLPKSAADWLGTLVARDFDSADKLEEALSADLKPYAEVVRRAAEADADITDIQPRKVDSLQRAALINWLLLPGVMLAGALWVHVVRRQE